MQCCQPGYAYTGPPSTTPYILNGYPEILGEGNLASVVSPNGSMQMVFVPTSQWLRPSPYQTPQNTNNANWTPTAWIIRSVLSPAQSTFYQQPQSCFQPAQNNSHSQFNPTPCLAPSGPFELKFHNDICTSTSDILYFYPNLRTYETTCLANLGKCPSSRLTAPPTSSDYIDEATSIRARGLEPMDTVRSMSVSPTSTSNFDMSDDADCDCRKKHKKKRKTYNKCECKADMNKKKSNKITCECKEMNKRRSNEFTCECKEINKRKSNEIICECKEMNKRKSNETTCECKEMNKRKSNEITCECKEMNKRKSNEITCECKEINKRKSNEIICECKEMNKRKSNEITCECKEINKRKSSEITCECKEMNKRNSSDITCDCKAAMTKIKNMKNNNTCECIEEVDKGVATFTDQASDCAGAKGRETQTSLQKGCKTQTCNIIPIKKAARCGGSVCTVRSCCNHCNSN